MLLAGCCFPMGSTCQLANSQQLAAAQPHRPNPIGLSLGRIIAIDAKRRILTIGGTDLVDGTPVLDIKPYLPNFDSRPLGEGLVAPEWLASAEPCVCPQWSLDADAERTVAITDDAERAWWKSAKHLRLYKKEAERGLTAVSTHAISTTTWCAPAPAPAPCWGWSERLLVVTAPPSARNGLQPQAATGVAVCNAVGWCSGVVFGR